MHKLAVEKTASGTIKFRLLVYTLRKGGKDMESKYLGISLIILIIGFVICFLAVLGFNTKLTYSDNDKKIEVRAENSNSVR